MRVGMWLGLLAATLHAIGYTLYGLDIWYGRIHTNPVSWALWIIGAFVAYVIVRDLAKDWAISLLNGVCAVGMVLIFALIFYQIKVSRVPIESTFNEITDIPIAVLDILTMFIWIRLRNKSLILVNTVFQVDIFLSFIPIALATHTHPNSETLAPWCIWTLAYLAQTFAVACRKTPDSEESLWTCLHYFGWHLGMSMMILMGTAAL